MIAIVVTLGLSISLIPILVRVLPPLRRDAETNDRDPDFRITVAALLGYVAIVALTLIVLDINEPGLRYGRDRVAAWLHTCGR